MESRYSHRGCGANEAVHDPTTGLPHRLDMPRASTADGEPMVTDRKFCRFYAPADTPFGMPEPPAGGLCLSAFLVITEKGHANRVLMGHLNPEAAWDHIGALDPSRTEVHRKGWMLPASHLIVRESPQEAARRIGHEQLGLPDLSVGEPKVVSEVSTPRRFPDKPAHWDLEFIFRGELEASGVREAAAWTELRFVDLDVTPKSAIARSHEDILESAGLRFGTP